MTLEFSYILPILPNCSISKPNIMKYEKFAIKIRNVRGGLGLGVLKCRKKISVGAWALNSRCVMCDVLTLEFSLHSNTLVFESQKRLINMKHKLSNGNTVPVRGRFHLYP